jgi:uncharacterized protein YjaG (DUF416 family)
MAIKEIEALQELNFTKQLTFAYLTCARLYPNYVFFSEKYEFGDPEIFGNEIEYIHYNIFQEKIEILTIKSFLEKLEESTPLPENFDTVLASSALDVYSVFFETLN